MQVIENKARHSKPDISPDRCVELARREIEYFQRIDPLLPEYVYRGYPGPISDLLGAAENRILFRLPPGSTAEATLINAEPPGCCRIMVSIRMPGSSITDICFMDIRWNRDEEENGCW